MWITLVLIVLLILALVAPGLPHRHGNIAGRTWTISSMKQAALGILMYTADHNDHFPLRFTSNEELLEALGDYAKDLKTVTTRNPNGGQVIPNASLGGVHLSSVLDPARTALLYETEDWPDDGGRIFAFVDGHVRMMRDPGQVNLAPSPSTSVAPFPQMSVLDDAMSYRFMVGDTAYLLSWVKTRVFEVTIEKLGSEWIEVYTGTTMAMPVIRRRSDGLLVYLEQPWFQINKPAPPSGQLYYEVVTVMEDNVESEVVRLATVR